MQKIAEKEIEKDINFLDTFMFIKPLTFETKSKMLYFCKERKFNFGQSVFNEGDSWNNIYLIREGEFEISKEIFLTEKPEDYLKVCSFMRYYSGKSKDQLSQIFNTDTKILFTSDLRSNEKLKLHTKSDTTKNKVRMALRGPSNIFGINEWLLGCPYRISSVTCVSKEALVLEIEADNFFKKIKQTKTSMIVNTVERLNLMYKWIINYVRSSSLIIL